MTLTLTRTTDILGGLGGLRGDAPRPILVGFAAETDDLLRKARDKRTRKRVDLIVANDVSRSDRGFDADTNAVTIIGEEGEQVVPLQKKEQVAAAILDRLEQLVRPRVGSGFSRTV
jgi:phosphopantothenoylcysteine decarboxylase/phosphopantothenate--cysteine ligase